MFAATPPLEDNNLLYSKAATSRGNRRHLGEYKLSFIDIKRAYFHAPEMYMLIYLTRIGRKACVEN